MKYAYNVNVESTLRMGATFVEGSSSTNSEKYINFSIILCAYMYCIICACVYVKYIS
jgi:hypothetical protein